MFRCGSPRRSEPCVQRAALEPCGSAAQADACPAPGRVDVVRESNGEGCIAEPDPERAAQSLERRVERVERRPFAAETTVLVPGRIQLFDPGEVEERLRELVPRRPLTAPDLFPRGCVVGEVVPEADPGRADRVEHPPRAAIDL